MGNIKVVKVSLNMNNYKSDISILKTFDNRNSAQEYLKKLLDRAYDKRMKGIYYKVGAVCKNSFIAHSATHQIEFKVL